MIIDLCEEVHAELRFLREEMTELRSNNTKVIDHMSARLDSLKSTMPSVVVAYELAQLRSDVSVVLDGSNALSNEIDLWFSRVTNRSALLHQKTTPTSLM